ncbi:unnamed protein product [Cunninghamella blakesleeana]
MIQAIVSQIQTSLARNGQGNIVDENGSDRMDKDDAIQIKTLATMASYLQHQLKVNQKMENSDSIMESDEKNKRKA